MEDLNNQLEQFNKELASEIDDKDTRINGYKSEIDTLEVILLEQDALTTKYKNTLDERNKQIKMMGE
jgi:flagellar hook-associated protein FlgK